MDQKIIELLGECVLNPHIRKPWVELSQAAFLNKDYHTGYWAAKTALRIKWTDDQDKKYFGHLPFDIAGVCAYYIGHYRESIDNYVNAWKWCPYDNRIILDLKMVRRYLNEYSIHILWPTIRPEVFKERINDWMLKAVHEDRIKVKIAVNTRKQRKELDDFADVIVVGSDKPGVAYASHRLSSNLDGLPGDIVILASDDFYPPDNWDIWVYEQFVNYFGGILVNDGINKDGVVTIPIMDFSCLRFLCNYIYHPSYNHCFSDNELFDNLSEYKLLKDLRISSPVFEHKHWYPGMRPRDKYDDLAFGFLDSDEKNYIKRKELPLFDKLK